jgi:hypothetical protein
MPQGTRAIGSLSRLSMMRALPPLVVLQDVFDSNHMPQEWTGLVT